MTLKSNWANGDTFTPAAANDIANAVNRTVIGAVNKAKTVFLEDYRDGVRTDNQIITAAFGDLQAGGELRFEQGRTYTVASGLTLDLTGKPNVLINGQGAVLNAPTMTGTVFAISGTQTATTTTLSAAVTQRTRTLSVASSSGFAAGDVVFIKSSSELFNSERDYYFKQDLARVKSVSSGTIVLDAPTWNTYSITGATVTITRYDPARNVKVRDLTITGPGTGIYQFGLRVNFFDGVELSNIRIDGIGTQGVSAYNGINFKVSDSSALNCNQDSYGYGFIANETHSAKFLNCYGSNNRHSFDADGSRDVTFMGCTAEGDRSSGISTHGNNDMAKIIGCTAKDCGGGIIVRARNTLVKDNHVRGTRVAADSSQTYQYGIYISGVLGGTELVVDGNHVDTSGPTNADAAFRSNAPLERATITNNYFGGSSSHVVYLAGPSNTEVRVTDNYVDCTDQDPALAAGFAMGILMSDSTPSNDNFDTNVDIDRNIISGALHTGIRVQGSVTAAPVTDKIRVRYNRIGSCGTNSISLISTYFGSNVEVYGNSVATALNLSGTFSAGPLVNNPDITVGTVAVSSKTTPADADLLPLVDSAASNGLKKLTWANLRTAAQDGLARSSDVVRTKGNLASDPGFDNPVFFNGSRYSTTVKRSGSYSLKLTADGTTQTHDLVCNDSAVQNLKVPGGAVYLVEFWVYGDAGNTNTSSGFSVQTSHTTASGTGNVATGTLAAAGTALNGTWTKLSGYITLPSDAVSSRFYIVLPSGIPSGNIYYFDDVVLRECVPLATSVTGTLPVSSGGTGATTLTGLVKGSGTTALTAATAGTDYVAPGGALGTPSSGTLTNCTFPTLNQNTTGTASNVTGTVAVANGGTGTTTLTGLVKGTGTTAMVAATAGTDYVAPGGALGTPSSGTLTNTTGLPISAITASTSAALGVGSLELGHASDTTLARSASGVVSVEGTNLARTADVQVFTSTGTWTKPANAVAVTVRCIGPGGGGGAGARGPSGTALSGGGGGAAGGMSEITLAASDLTSTVLVSVGAGGVGASGQTADGTAGAAGSASASNTQFGSFVAAYRGGGGGGGGLAVAGSAGAGQSAGFSYGISDGATGGVGSATGAAGGSGGRTGGSAGGGGGGGGITTAPAVTAGGAGGVTMLNGALSVGTAGSGAAGGNGSASTIKATGTGGGGGGGNTGGAGYAGGNGGIYGAGGGGGGASLNGSASGAGGNGADGVCIVTTYF